MFLENYKKLSTYFFFKYYIYALWDLKIGFFKKYFKKMSLTPIYLCKKTISYIMGYLNEIILKLSIMFEFNLTQALCFNNTWTNMRHMTQKFYKTIQWGKTFVFASKFRVMNLVLSYGASYEWTFFFFHFCVLTTSVVRKLAFG